MKKLTIFGIIIILFSIKLLFFPNYSFSDNHCFLGEHREDLTTYYDIYFVFNPLNNNMSITYINQYRMCSAASPLKPGPFNIKTDKTIFSSNAMELKLPLYEKVRITDIENNQSFLILYDGTVILDGQLKKYKESLGLERFTFCGIEKNIVYSTRLIERGSESDNIVFNCFGKLIEFGLLDKIIFVVLVLIVFLYFIFKHIKNNYQVKLIKKEKKVENE